MRPVDSRRPVLVFVGLTAALSSIFWCLIAKSGHSGGEFVNYVGALMWCPGVAALIASKYLGRDVSALGWNWGKTRYQVASYLIPLAYGAVSYGFVWLAGFGGFVNKTFVDLLVKDFGLGPMPAWLALPLYGAFTATIGVITGSATVLGEEIGWRGFLVPELAKRHGFTATAAISGLIWAIWHYPLLLLGDYHPATPVWFYLPLFTVTVPLVGFAWTWMRLKSGSLWPCVVLHAAHNTFIQRFFDPMTVYDQRTPYVAGEFGAALGVTAVVVAAYFWVRRREVETAHVQD
jgi:uncharacterized protein